MFSLFGSGTVALIVLGAIVLMLFASSLVDKGKAIAAKEKVLETMRSWELGQERYAKARRRLGSVLSRMPDKSDSD